jgi:hypothetical protein
MIAKLQLQQLERQQGENLLGEGNTPVTRGKQLFDGFLSKVASIQAPFAQEHATDVVSQVCLYPAFNRKRKPGLSPFDDLFGDMILKGPLKKSFSRRTSDSEPRRQAGGKFQQNMIQERNPQLQRVTHRNPVCLYQEIIREGSFCIDILHLVKQRFVLHLAKEITNDLDRTVLADRVGKTLRVEFLFAPIEETER